MPVNVIDVIKPKNNGSFPVVEDVDVKMSDGTRLSAAIANKANKSELNSKADKSNTYTKSEVDNKIASAKVDAYTKSESDNKYATKSDLTSKADAAVVTEIQTALGSKAEKSEVSDLQSTIEEKADKSDVSELQNIVSTKADKATTDDIQNQIDNFDHTPEVDEVVNARNSSDGTAYTNLKARLDKENSDLKEELRELTTNIGEKQVKFSMIRSAGHSSVDDNIRFDIAQNERIYVKVNSERGLSESVTCVIYTFINEESNALGSVQLNAPETEFIVINGCDSIGVYIPPFGENANITLSVRREQSLRITQNYLENKVNYNSEQIGRKQSVFHLEAGQTHSSVMDKIPFDLESNDKIKIGVTTSKTLSQSKSVVVYAYNGSNGTSVGTVIINSGETTFSVPNNCDSLGVYIAPLDVSCDVTFSAESYKSLKSEITKTNDILSVFAKGGTITHTETATGSKTVVFDNPIRQGERMWICNTGTNEGASNNFSVKLMDKSGATTTYGNITKGQALLIETEFDVYGLSSYVNGTEFNFVIKYGDDIKSEIQNIKSMIRKIVKFDMRTGSISNHTYVAEPKRLTLCETSIPVKKGDVVKFNADSLWVDIVLYENDTTIKEWGWLTGSQSLTMIQDGSIHIIVANGSNFSTSSNIVPDDFTADICIISNVIGSDSGDVKDNIINSFNSIYHKNQGSWENSGRRFCSLINNKTEIESFLFYTDPHLAEGTGWEDEFKEIMAQIQQGYNSTPTSFALCGGDWIGNGDTVDSATYKLGYIDGVTTSMFKHHHMMIGNHDTNYQGVTRLSNDTLKNLMFRETNSQFYKFRGQNTEFYLFDTGADNDYMTQSNTYLWNQAKWFANSLLTDNSKHIGLLGHIFYITATPNPIVSPFVDIIFKIAQAYNDRTTTDVNGEDFDYSSATGNIEFYIAGHNHADLDVTYKGIPVVITTQVRADTSVGATYDLVLVDYDSRKIHTVRVGSGSDRTIQLI